MAISSDNEPNTYTEAIQKSEWIDAMKKEIKALEDNNTWYLTDLPTRKNTFGVNGFIK